MMNENNRAGEKRPDSRGCWSEPLIFQLSRGGLGQKSYGGCWGTSCCAWTQPFVQTRQRSFQFFLPQFRGFAVQQACTDRTGRSSCCVSIHHFILLWWGSGPSPNSACTRHWAQRGHGLLTGLFKPKQEVGIHSGVAGLVTLTQKKCSRSIAAKNDKSCCLKDAKGLLHFPVWKV